MNKHVKVKPLEWSEVFIGLKRATTDIGRYEVYCFDRYDWRMYPAGKIASDSTSYPSLEAAQAAAQADYERRILSSLEPSPAFEEMVEALEGLVKCCEEHDAAIAGVMGKPPGWKDAYLDTARAVLASVKGERT